MEDPLLYYLTLFTFMVIFLLCYIRYVFTFFEQHRIPSISTPKFPTGNIGDVITGNSPLFMKLWKYYKYCKRHRFKFAGFYLFIKPAILITNWKYFNIETVSDNRKTIDHKLCDLSEFFQQPWRDILPNLSDGEQDCSRFVSDYLVVVVLKIFDLEKCFERIIVDHLQKKTTSFWILLQVSCSYFKRSQNTNKQFREIVQNLVNHRKKNDIRKDDIVQILIDSGYNIDDITDLSLETVKTVEIACNLLLLSCLELALNQEIQDDLRGEIIRFNKDRSYDNLAYLNTVISETLRKYPPVALIWSDDSLIPVLPNGPVFVSIFGIHHDPELYPNPESFDPDRFSEENLHFIDPDNYLPFGKRDDGVLVRFIVRTALIELISKFQLTIGKRTNKLLNFTETTDGIKLKDNLWLKLNRLL